MENSDDYAAHFELIARVSAGDMDAYDAMYRQYVAAATRVARTVANSGDEATDVVFEAFARLLVRLREHGEPDVGIEEYLRTCIRRLAIERHPDVTQGDVPPPHPDDAVGADDRFSRVRLAYEALPDEWQQILWHAEVERKPQLTLARGLEMSQSTVAALVLRSREGLRQAYGAIALADDVEEGCRDFAPNIPVHVKGMLPAKVGRELDKHLRRCGICRKFRDDYVLLLSDLRPTLFGALLRPADPQAVPVATSPDPDHDSVIAAHDADTREVPVPVPAAVAGPIPEPVPAPAEPADSAPSVGMIGGIIPNDDTAEHPRDRRRRGVLAGGLAAVAAATIFAAFALVAGDPAGDTPSADDGGYADGAAGLAAGGNAGGRVLGAGPTVAVMSETQENDADSTGGGVVPVDDGERLDEGTDDATADPPAPVLPQPEDTPSDGSSSSPSSEPSTDPSPQGDPPVPPSITSHPTNASGQPGQTVSFAVGVEGYPDPAVRWQKRASPGGSWSNMANAMSATLRVTITAGEDGSQYRAVATNDGGKATSRAATLTVVHPPPEVTKHPDDKSAPAGGEVTFTASASTASEAGFTDVWWEENVDGTWTRMDVDVPVAKNTSLTLSNVQPGRDGSSFRAVFANDFGETASGPGTLTVSSS